MSLIKGKNSPHGKDLKDYSVRNTVTHTCMVCSKRFSQQILQNSSQNVNVIKINKTVKILDKYSIFFVLETCLELPSKKCKAIFKELMDNYGEQSFWGTSFCPEHEKLIENAQKKYKAIVQKQKKLDNLKAQIQMEIHNCLQTKTEKYENQPSDGFMTLRESLKKELLPNSASERNKKTEKPVPTTNSKDTTSKLRAASSVTKDIVNSKNNNPAADNKFNSTAGDVNVKTEMIDLTEEDEHPLFKNLSNVCQARKKDNINVSTTEPANVLETSRRNLNEQQTQMKYESPILSSPRADVNVSSSSTPYQPSLRASQNFRPNQIRDRRPFKCRVCTLRFAVISNRDYHQATTHGCNSFKPFLCRTCGKYFASEYTLKRHQTRMHDMRKQNNNCPPKRIGSNNVHRFKNPYYNDPKHNNKTRPVAQKKTQESDQFLGYSKGPFECHGCGEEFNQRIHLFNHRHLCGKFAFL